MKMRALETIFASAVCLAIAAPLAMANPEGPMPDDKEFVELREGERNPYAKPIVEESVDAEEAETEEARIRKALASLPLSGVRDNGYEIRVLLGSIILQEGDPLPPIVPGQSERLVVRQILPDQVELVFVEREEGVEPRRIEIPVKLDPRVTYAIGPRPDAIAQPPTEGGPTAVFPEDAPEPNSEEIQE